VQEVIPISDAERIALIGAEREVALIETIVLHLEVSDLAKDRAIRGLRRVRESLGAFRSRYSLAPLALDPDAVVASPTTFKETRP
jgi:hypothetical protein